MSGDLRLHSAMASSAISEHPEELLVLLEDPARRPDGPRVVIAIRDVIRDGLIEGAAIAACSRLAGTVVYLGRNLFDLHRTSFPPPIGTRQPQARASATLASSSSRRRLRS